jgi:hypothetical protein
MPGLDGTGPQGRGSMTGGGFGYCTGYYREGEVPARPPGFGRGFFGRGFHGGGRGRRNMFYATGLPGWTRYSGIQQPSREQEIQWLQEDARTLEDQLKQVRQRLDELKKED